MVLRARQEAAVPPGIVLEHQIRLLLVNLKPSGPNPQHEHSKESLKEEERAHSPFTLYDCLTSELHRSTMQVV